MDVLSAKKITTLGVEQTDKHIYLIYRTNQDDRRTVRFAVSTDGLDFVFKNLARGFYKPSKIPSKYQKILKPRPGYFDHGKITIESISKIPSGNLIIYHSQTDDYHFYVGAAVLSPDEKLTWRSDVPVWETSNKWHDSQVNYIGSVNLKGKILGYWLIDQKRVFATVYPSFKLRTNSVLRNVSLSLNRSDTNPLIKPSLENSWESFNTFNPAAIYEGGKVHILYRAQGFDFVSVVGYASSRDGINVDEKLTYPIYTPKEDFEWIHPTTTGPNLDPYSSGGGFGGIEDPRITKIGDRIYMLYVAYNGVDAQRIALTSISVDDFLSHRWLWEKPVLISPPNVIDKSAVIFPEKINGKYVIMHRVFPNLLIDFVDDLNFDGDRWLKGEYRIPVRPQMWDSRKIGAGAPPIKTNRGWLLIYYATCDQEGASRYLIGAMLLDLKDPTKVICRSKRPILTPQASYENEGFKAGIVYPCGAVVIDGVLYVYYGGADSFVCVATADLKTFLDDLCYRESPQLESTFIRQIV